MMLAGGDPERTLPGRYDDAPLRSSVLRAISYKSPLLYGCSVSYSGGRRFFRTYFPSNFNNVLCTASTGSQFSSSLDSTSCGIQKRLKSIPIPLIRCVGE